MDITLIQVDAFTDQPFMGNLAEGGVLVTSSADTPGFDFVSRFFAPARGINEDPHDRLGAVLPGSLLAKASGERCPCRSSGLLTRRRGACASEQ
jgi:predicted PhzF superfamily epimerase YddE/YHI9